MSASRIEYSEKYADDNNEYRHVILPKELAKTLPKGRILSESEWRRIGVQQSRGWHHYAIHRYVICHFHVRKTLIGFKRKSCVVENTLILFFLYMCSARNPIFFCSDVHWVPIPKRVRWTPNCCEPLAKSTRTSSAYANKNEEYMAHQYDSSDVVFAVQ
jgi:hypothetical protein